jgi:hypothetical protein
MAKGDGNVTALVTGPKELADRESRSSLNRVKGYTQARLFIE